MNNPEPSKSNFAALETVTDAKTQPDLLRFVQEVSLLMHEGEPDEAGEPFERTSENLTEPMGRLSEANEMAEPVD